MKKFECSMQKKMESLKNEDAGQHLVYFGFFHTMDGDSTEVLVLADTFDSDADRVTCYIENESKPVEVSPYWVTDLRQSTNAASVWSSVLGARGSWKVINRKTLMEMIGMDSYDDALRG